MNERGTHSQCPLGEGDTTFSVTKMGFWPNTFLQSKVSNITVSYTNIQGGPKVSIHCVITKSTLTHYLTSILLINRKGATPSI